MSAKLTTRRADLLNDVVSNGGTIELFHPADLRIARELIKLHLVVEPAQEPIEGLMRITLTPAGRVAIQQENKA